MTLSISALTIATALGSGLIAGVFLAFSTFVMRALARLPAADGVLAMQWINRTVLNPIFLGLFVGTGVGGLLLAGVAILQSHDASTTALVGGALLYVVGTFGVTVAFNVPLNEALARVEATSEEAERLWAHYLKRWTSWNHVRTVAAVLAAWVLTTTLG